MGEDSVQDSAGPRPGRRLSVDEAARALGLSVDAIRKRVQRDTIPYEKDAAGRVTIILDTSETLQDDVHDLTGHSPDKLLEAKDETIEELKERVRRLEHDLDIRNEEIRRRDHLLAAALDRIPAQLEAPQEAREMPESAEEHPEEGEPHSASEGFQTSATRAWWRRMLDRL